MEIIERLKELEAKASPGPWRASRVAESIEIRQEKFNKPRIACLYEVGHWDAEFIINMRNALPKVLALVEAADEIRRLLKYYHDKEYKHVVAQVQLGNERLMHRACENFDDARGTLSE